MNPSMLHLRSANWGWILLRGIVAILFGITAFSWPLLTLRILVLLYGAYVMVDGVLALIAAIRDGLIAPRWWLAGVGLLGVTSGLLILLWPGIGALALLMIIGVIAIVRGIFEILSAITLRKEITGEWLLILGGLVSLFMGIGILCFPGAGALAMAWLIATYSLLLGVFLCALAFRLRSHSKARGSHT